MNEKYMVLVFNKEHEIVHEEYFVSLNDAEEYYSKMNEDDNRVDIYEYTVAPCWKLLTEDPDWEDK